MKDLGHLQDINLYVPEKPANTMVKNNSFVTHPNNPPETSKMLTNAAQSLVGLEKINVKQPETPPQIPQTNAVSKQALINRIEEIRKKAQTPIKEVEEKEKKPYIPPIEESLKKIESSVTVAKKKTETTIPKIRKSMEFSERRT